MGKKSLVNRLRDFMSTERDKCEEWCFTMVPFYDEKDCELDLQLTDLLNPKLKLPDNLPDTFAREFKGVQRVAIELIEDMLSPAETSTLDELDAKFWSEVGHVIEIIAVPLKKCLKCNRFKYGIPVGASKTLISFIFDTLTFVDGPELVGIHIKF